MTPVDRRTFLSDMALVTAVAAAGVAPRSSRGQPLGVHPDAQNRSFVKAPCRLCGVGCDLRIGLESGRAVSVAGDPQSPVAMGLACAKGYHAAQALYGTDRITRAKIRRNNVLVDVPLTEALDAIAARIRDTLRQHGPDSIALYGSAQWTMIDAYVASKLFKGALGSNNVETSTRLYAASVMSGLKSTFGLDGAVGNFGDIEQADVFVIWDANLAESDPVLFSRMLERRRKNPAVRIIELATRTTRTSYAADRSMLHAPHSALAIANGICQEIVERKWIHRDFLTHHVAFKRSTTALGDGIKDATLVTELPVDASLEEFTTFLDAYKPERVQELASLPADSIRWLASVYADPARRVMSVWGAEVNQALRGAWTNNAIYNIHLLVAKIAAPGNAALALTGQPNGGNAVHDAGTLSHTLPRGDVTDILARQRAADIWKVPADRISATPARSALGIFRAIEKGDVRFLWIQATNPMVSLPNAERYRRAAAASDCFIVVSEAYPTATTDIADVILPAALWIEREGVYGNVERRLQHFAPSVTPPGDAASDASHMIDVAKRLGFGAMFPANKNDVAAQTWEELRRFNDGPRTALPALADLRGGPGMQWPIANGRGVEWRYNAKYDPTANRARGPYDFYGHADGRAWIWLRAHDAPPEQPDRDFSLWLTTGPVLEHWGSGALTQRIPTLHRSVPHAYVELNRDDANTLGVRHGDTVRVVSRRGSLTIEARIDYRAQPPRGVVFVPTFDEAHPINRLTLDTQCPVSGQPGAGACAVRIEPATRGGT